MVPLKIKHANSPFDYDRLVNNPNLELWVIRVPDTVSRTNNPPVNRFSADQPD